LSIKEKIKTRLVNHPFFYSISKKIHHFFIFNLFLAAKLFRFLQEIFGYAAAKTVFLTQPGNIYFKNYYSDVILTEKIKYKKNTLVVKINTYWDYWRTFDFESYSIQEVENDLEDVKRNKPIVYYEIGANIGYSALFIAKILGNNGHVYALEVEPTNFKTLCDNTILNKLDNLTPINIGISENSNVSKFYYNIHHTKMHKSLPVSGMGAHSLVLDSNLHDNQIFCNSLFMPFDNLVKDFKLKMPTHIYIDTHGSELSVVDSMKSSIKNEDLEKIMIDIEQKDIKKVSESKVYKKLTNVGFEFKSNDILIGSDIFQNSYRSVFFRMPK